MKKVYLHGGWSFTDASIGKRLDARIPGCLHTDLIAAGIISDLYYRDNDEKYRWVEDCEPIYETRFDAELGKSVKLKFDGIDTFAKIYLNGKLLGEAHNMFIPHEYDVTDLIKETDNDLRVEFTSPVKAVEGMPVAPGYAFTGDRINARRIQCTYSWDWVARFVTVGIFRPVYLEYREGLEIEDVYVRTDAVDRFGASIVAEYTLSGFDKPGIVEAELVSPSGRVVYRDRFYADRELMVRKMDIPSPELWYPAGYGEQPLYSFKASTDSSKYETKLGIRTIRIINHKDAKGTEYYNRACEATKSEIAGPRTVDDNFFGFKVVVNEKEIFCRGANWVPCDPFASEESDEKIRALIKSTRDMGANILRVWGGGLFERPIFFDECDKQGILVCHDFLMACGQYPEKQEWFINELLLESEYAVKLMRNHPCLAWFHGDNENAVDGSDTLPDYTGRDSAMNGIFPSIYKYSKNIPFLASSPWGGDKFNSITSGTSHNTNFVGEIFNYGYTTDCHDYKEFFAQFTSRFVSEEPTFGAISRESLLEFMTEEDIVGEDESILKHHSKTNPALPVHIYDDIRRFTEQVLGEFESGEDRYFKQKYIQCEWVRITQELVLRNLGYSNGIIYWMFNDCWPASLGWAFVDYYKRRKPAYYTFKRLTNPVVGSFDVDGKTLVISNTSDDSDTAFVTAVALDMKDGFKEIGRLDTEVFVDPYSAQCIDVSGLNTGDNVLLVCDVICADSFYRSYYKSGKLEIVKDDSFEIVSMTNHSVTIRANKYLQVVELSGDYIFSDNYFTMLDGEEITVTFEKFSAKADDVKVTTYTLK
jgi:beta-mannosidase